MVELKRLNLGSLMRKRDQDIRVDPDADTPESNASRGVVCCAIVIRPTCS